MPAVSSPNSIRRTAMPRAGFRPPSYRTTSRGPHATCCAGCTSKAKTPGQACHGAQRGGARRRRRCPSWQPQLRSPCEGGTHHRQFWIPRGFAHGFVVLSDSADFFYKCDELYSPADELVLRWDDPKLNIDWGTTSPAFSTRSQRPSGGRLLRSSAESFEVRFLFRTCRHRLNRCRLAATWPIFPLDNRGFLKCRSAVWVGSFDALRRAVRFV